MKDEFGSVPPRVEGGNRHIKGCDCKPFWSHCSGYHKARTPSATEAALLGVSPIEALRKLQEKLKGVMKTGGPVDDKPVIFDDPVNEEKGFEIFEDDLFPEVKSKDLPCICKITAHGPIEDKRCLWHQERKKRGGQ